MTIEQRISEDYRNAMKSRNVAVVGTLRLLLASLKNELIARMQKPLEETDELAVIRREVKKRKESAEFFRVGGNIEKAEQEEAEAGMLTTYLPAQLAEAEVRAIVQSAVEQVRAVGPADFGKVMGVTMKALQGKADGAVVQAMVKQALSAKVSL